MGEWLGRLKKRYRDVRWIAVVYHGFFRCLFLMRLSWLRMKFGRNFPSQFFEGLFEKGEDPWGYQGDEVSQVRRQLLLDRIPAGIYRRVMEVGCASGWITSGLAERCGEVLAVDISEKALEMARRRCSGFGNVVFERFDVLNGEVSGKFDLVLCAGVLVYLPFESQKSILEKLVGAVMPGGVLILEHTREAYAGETAGSLVHELYIRDKRLKLQERIQEDNYEIVTFVRVRE